MTAENKIERSHALCSASGAHRWLECPGSVGLSLALPEPPPSEYALEGTRAHALAEEVLNVWIKDGEKAAIAYLDSAQELYSDTYDGALSMIDHVKTYLNICIEYWEKFAKDEQKRAGRRVELKLSLNSELSMYGTADFVMSGPMGTQNVGVIVDLKYGKGLEVEIEGNAQLAYYACALTRTSSKRLDEVIVAVVQPRVDNFHKEIRYSRDEIEHWHGVLTRGAEKALYQAMAKKYETKAGKHCRFCPVKATCQTHVNYLQEQASLDFIESKPPSVITITPERLARILSAKSDIKKFLDSAEEFATSLLMGGKEVPGFKLVRANTHRRWKSSESETAEKLVSLGVKDPYEKKLKSPAQVEKLKINVDDLTIKPEGAVVIVPVDDKRAEVSPVGNDFTNMIEG